MAYLIIMSFLCKKLNSQPATISRYCRAPRDCAQNDRDGPPSRRVEERPTPVVESAIAEQLCRRSRRAVATLLI